MLVLVCVPDRMPVRDKLRYFISNVIKTPLYKIIAGDSQTPYYFEFGSATQTMLVQAQETFKKK